MTRRLRHIVDWLAWGVAAVVTMSWLSVQVVRDWWQHRYG